MNTFHFKGLGEKSKSHLVQILPLRSKADRTGRSISNNRLYNFTKTGIYKDEIMFLPAGLSAERIRSSHPGRHFDPADISRLAGSSARHILLQDLHAGN